MWSITAMSRAWAAVPARPSPSSRPRTPPATGSRWCSGCRCASRSIRRNWRRARCAWAFPWTPPSTPRRASAMTAAADHAPLKGAALWIVAVLLAMANFIAVLDMTIANVSMASIAGSLGISTSQGTWVITSYSVAEAIIVPLTGWLAARFGAVRVFTTAMLLFGTFSAFCGLSTSLSMLVFGRIMQGLSGGSLMPLSQTLLLRVFPKERAPAAMALWAMTTLVAPVLGPIMGGALCDNFSWPFIFFINLPITLICAPIAARMLRRFEQALQRAPIDRVGLALLVVFVSALQIMLDIGK